MRPAALTLRRGARVGAALGVLVALLVAPLLCRHDEPPSEPDLPRPAAAWLPPLEPVVAALRAEAWRVRTPEQLAELRRRFDRPFPRSVQADAIVEARTRSAIERLSEVVAGDLDLSAALGPALDRSAGLEIWSDSVGLLRFDALHPSLKIPPCVAGWPVDPFAMALSHELTHLADSTALADALGLRGTQAALLTDATLGTPASGLTVETLESRAFHVELRAARALGIRIPSPQTPIPESRDRGCSMRATDLVFTLSNLQAAEPDEAAWNAQIRSMTSRHYGP